MSAIVLTDSRGTPLMDAGSSSSHYDSAKSSPMRSSMLAFPTNSRQELTPQTRKETVRKIRAIDACLGFIGRIKQKTGQHSVGKGVFPRPITQDEDWNQAVSSYLDPIFENPDIYTIDGSRDFYEDQRLAAESQIDDGEYFSAFTRDETNRLQMQPLDVFEIEQPIFDRASAASFKDWNDGVRTDLYGRVVEYAIKELPGPWSGPAVASRFVEAGNMIHLFKRRRPKQWRGMPLIYAGANSLIDVLDLKALEVGSAKLHAALGLVVKKQKGEAGKTGVSNAIEKIIGESGKVTSVSEKFWSGAAIQYLGLDEGIDLLTSDRPSPNLLAFMDWLYRDASVGTGLPVEVLYEMSKLGGATARAVLDDAQWFFEMMQDRVVMRHSRPIYLSFVGDAIAKGELPICRDPVWWAVEWQGPAKVTVDYGRTADANIKLLKNGCLSYEAYYEERGQNARTQHMRQIQHLAWLRDQCKANEIPME